MLRKSPTLHLWQFEQIKEELILKHLSGIN